MTLDWTKPLRIRIDGGVFDILASVDVNDDRYPKEACWSDGNDGLQFDTFTLDGRSAIDDPPIIFNAEPASEPVPTAEPVASSLDLTKKLTLDDGTPCTLATSEFRCDDGRPIGVLSHGPRGDYFRRFRPDGTSGGMRRLINAPEPPKVLELWINIYADGKHALHTTEDGAIRGRGIVLDVSWIATKRVPIEYRPGDDDTKGGDA